MIVTGLNGALGIAWYEDELYVPPAEHPLCVHAQTDGRSRRSSSRYGAD